MLYKDLKDPRLTKLKEATVLKSKVDSATKKYLYAFQRWRQWAEDKLYSPYRATNYR